MIGCMLSVNVFCRVSVPQCPRTGACVMEMSGKAILTESLTQPAMNCECVAAGWRHLVTGLSEAT